MPRQNGGHHTPPRLTRPAHTSPAYQHWTPAPNTAVTAGRVRRQCRTGTLCMEGHALSRSLSAVQLRHRARRLPPPRPPPPRCAAVCAMPRRGARACSRSNRDRLHGAAALVRRHAHVVGALAEALVELGLLLVIQGGEVDAEERQVGVEGRAAWRGRGRSGGVGHLGVHRARHRLEDRVA